MTPRRASCLLLLTFCLLISCAENLNSPQNTENNTQDLTIFAAASLTRAFEDLAGAYKEQHPNAAVRLNYAGSQTLRLQIEHGARPDLFASANPEHMQALRDAGRVAPPERFARNRLVVITPRDNPAGITGPADLPRARHIALGTPEVPVGAYAERFLQRATPTLGEGFAEQVHARVASREPDVRLIVTRVRLGAADAGIVYATDAQAERDHLQRFPIPDHLNPAADYPIAALTDAPHPDAAQAWLQLLRSPRGRQLLALHGFEPPDDAP